MFFPTDLGPDFLRIVKPLWESSEPDHIRMRQVWSMLTGLQGVVLSRILRDRVGNKVMLGPFKGMELTPDVQDAHFAPYLLGCYEWELHKVVEQAITHHYAQILNIGCYFGYYSIGFARRMPQIKAYAYDIDDKARKKCARMVEANGVDDRVIIGERFNGEDYARMAGPETLVIMDIEGAEYELLNPDKYPALRGMDVIVEMHDCYNPLISETIAHRFESSHHIEIFPNQPFYFPLEKIFGTGYVPNHFDSLIATWEGREGPTPWAVLKRK